jgi:lipopolysaccharide biosynthesis glycosyltransferase
MGPYSLCFTIDYRYVSVLRVLIYSLVKTHPGETFNLYILHKSLSDADIVSLEQVAPRDTFIIPIVVNDELFNNAPTSRRYPKEIYFRLFASYYLPTELDRILYLDPDIICVNSMDRFYHQDFEDALFIGATHMFPFLQRLNELRLGLKSNTPYMNTGVMLLHLEKLRLVQKQEDIKMFIQSHKALLFLPDQDILTSLYGNHLKLVDPMIYNLSDRFLKQYSTKNRIKISLAWVKENTVFIHYCGRNKPWKSPYFGVLNVFYTQTIASMHKGDYQ